MPAAIAESLRRELTQVVSKAYRGLSDFPNGDDCSVLLAYCGDKQGLEILENWPPERGTEKIADLAITERS